MTALRLGSLFDGIGVFPLAAVRCGIEPVWASEIEKAPISITKRHFPDMAHLGDVTKLDGREIPPVHIITFGSPCQNLSQIGNRKGLAGEKSSLFFQAIRIIREMREATNGLFPAIAVWENVPYALQRITSVLPTHPAWTDIDTETASLLVGRPHLPHDPHLLHKKAGTRPRKTCPCASNGQILTRAASADDVHRRQFCTIQLCDVAHMGHAGETQLCDRDGKGFDLRRPHRCDATADRGQRESTNTIEQAAHRQSAHFATACTTVRVVLTAACAV